MVACKFEPHDNWLPPCHRVPPHLETALIDTHVMFIILFIIRAIDLLAQSYQISFNYFRYRAHCGMLQIYLL